MVFVRVCGDFCNNFGSEALKVAVKPVISNVVTTIEAYNLKTSSSHCELAAGPTAFDG